MSAARASMVHVQQLTERDREILEFEERWPVPSGAKDHAIRQALGMRPARYYQLLNALIEKPAALAGEPMLVRSLLSVRARRTASRASRVFG
jgi:hypothetical protein